MRRDQLIWNLTLCVLLQACAGPEEAPGARVQALGGCLPGGGGSNCTNSNGTGIHIAHTAPESSFGLIDDQTASTWRLTGFTNTPTGVVANGWYEAAGAPIAANGQVTGAHYLGLPYPVKAIDVAGTMVTLRLDLPLLGELALSAPSLVGVVLHLTVPGATSSQPVRFDVSFDALRMLPGQPTEVLGYMLNHRRQGASGAWRSFCRGAQGQALAAVFSEGAQWNPNDATRTSGSALSSLSCEGGAIVSCMLWGYQPWLSAVRDHPMGVVSLAETHQACIQMKRAAYCGDATSYTVDGTLITVADPFMPAMQTSAVSQIEAIWTPTGASCLTQQRHPEAGFQGCPQPLPPCPSVMPSGWLVASGLP